MSRKLSALFPCARYRLLCVIVWVLPMCALYAQSGSPRQRPAPREIFVRVQDGLSTGNIDTFSPFLASPVLMNLRDGESGYFSPSQAHYLLENYLKFRRLARFSFTTVDDSVSNPYATGSVSFNYRGKRGNAQLYISLSPSGDRWMITQMNIY